jgi:hypothetical protein
MASDEHRRATDDHQIPYQQAVVEDGQQVGHFFECEAERFHFPDQQQPLDIGFGVEAEAALAARGRRDEADLFVVANGARAQLVPFGDLADLHVLAHLTPAGFGGLELGS